MALDEKKLNESIGKFVADAGAVIHSFGRFRRSAETPFNPIFEARWQAP
jgi:hypothetical protein